MKLGRNEIIVGSIIIFIGIVYFLFFKKKTGTSTDPGTKENPVYSDNLEEDTYVRRNDCIQNCDRISDFMIMDCDKFSGPEKLKCLNKVKASKTACRTGCGGGDVNDLATANLLAGTSKESSYAVPSYYYSGFPVDMTRMFNESAYDANGTKKVDKKVLYFCCNDPKYAYGPTPSGYCFDQLGKRQKAKICFKN